MKKIGFTGTRSGMQQAQYIAVYNLLAAMHPFELHHGDCIGADATVHTIARTFDPPVRIVGHPPIIARLRAFCKFDEERDAKEYLSRNRDIVRETDGMLATPAQHTPQIRSGTWSTIRFAREMKRALIIVFPDGSVIKERCT